MRRSGSLLIPLSLIAIYYAALAGIAVFLSTRYPSLTEFLPVLGLEDMPASSGDVFQPVYDSADANLRSAAAPVRLFGGILGAFLLAVPVSWVYFITSRTRRIDQSFVQTILIMPVLVTGIAFIVLNSLALAFSLAGIVAAVRFRFSLSKPAEAMYIFVAIGIGLGAGISAVGVSYVISLTFVIATLLVWKLEYGKTLSGPFLTMMTRRDGGEDEY